LPVPPKKKNDSESILLRDFAADTLAKNGTDANFTPNTLSDQNFILPEIMAVFDPDANLRVDSVHWTP
jgi:hypothetical protein